MKLPTKTSLKFIKIIISHSGIIMITSYILLFEYYVMSFVFRAYVDAMIILYLI